MPSQTTAVDPAAGPPPEERAPAGRPLDTSRDEVLRQAALELIAEVGYDRLTIDAVAARARAGKATVYRRWASKADLVADAFACSGFKGVEPPDTGDLRSDLLVISRLIWTDSGPVPRASIMAGMLSALLANPDLREALQSVAVPPATSVVVVIQRAVERGEIPVPDDLETIGMVMPGMCMFHLVKKGTVPDPTFFESAIDRVVLPALAYRGPRARKGSR